MFFTLRWRIAGLLFLAGVLNYLDRMAISMASPAIKEELHVDAAQMGYVFSSFFLGYALLNLIGGMAADRFGPSRVLSIALLAWSAFCGLTAVASGFFSLLLTRTLFGAAEGPFGATSAKMLNQWFPRRELLSSLAFVASGTPLGAVVAGPLFGMLLPWWGWRGSLMAVACLGVGFAMAWSLFARALASRPGALAAEVEASSALTPATATNAAPDSREEAGATAHPMLFYVRSPVVIANAVAYFAYTYLLSAYLSWLPTFFVSRHHLDLRSAALGSAAPWILGFAGVWGGALLADRIFRSTGRLLYSRTIVQAGGLLSAAFGTALVGEVPSAFGAVGVASVALFALYLSGTTFWAVVQDVVPSRLVGRLSGFTHLVANLGGILSPALTGAIVQRTDSFRLAWLVAAGVSSIAALAVLAASRSRQAIAASRREDVGALSQAMP